MYVYLCKIRFLDNLEHIFLEVISITLSVPYLSISVMLVQATTLDMITPTLMEQPS